MKPKTMAQPTEYDSPWAMPVKIDRSLRECKCGYFYLHEGRACYLNLHEKWAESRETFATSQDERAREYAFNVMLSYVTEDNPPYKPANRRTCYWWPAFLVRIWRRFTYVHDDSPVLLPPLTSMPLTVRGLTQLGRTESTL